jgi:GntR family transcriptional regulator / MocR family aminotransferase
VTNADPETIVISNGYAQAVSLPMGVLAARGARTLAVEDPSASDDARPIAGAPPSAPCKAWIPA